MKKFGVLLLCVALSAGLFACSKDKPEQQTAPPSETASATPSGEVYSDDRDPLNGSDQVSEYKPIVVQMDNSPQARPQYGIQCADIVYECQVEGSMSRLMAVFNSELPERVEAVRSARIYFIALAGEYDPVYVHFGGTNTPGHEGNIYDYMAKNGGVFKHTVDGLTDEVLLTRDPSRPKPHNAMLDIARVRAELFDYTPKERKHRFDPDVEITGDSAMHVSIPFDMGQTHTEYDYDEEQGLYLRKQGGKAFTDGITNEQVTVKNLVVQFAVFTPLPGTQKADVIGEGDALFFIDGTVRKGKWKKGSIPDATVYTDEDGNPLILRPGNTWFHLVPTTMNVTYN